MRDRVAKHGYPTFFLHKEGVQKILEEPQLSQVVGTELQTGPFTSLAQKNQKLEDKACHLTDNTLGQNMKTQSGPWVAPPRFAGVLQASPPKNRAQMLEHPSPAKIRRCWTPCSHRGRTTWWQQRAELQQEGSCRASKEEVDDSRPPCRPWIAEARLPLAVDLQKKPNHRHRLPVDLQRTEPSRIAPPSPPPWWPGRARSRTDLSRSRGKPERFIEGIVGAPPLSASGSDHRSAAQSSQTATSHPEPLHLHRGQIPLGITPFSTWVK
jgi:hypothetical protein